MIFDVLFADLLPLPGVSGNVGGYRLQETLSLGDSLKIMWPPQDAKDDDLSPHLR